MDFASPEFTEKYTNQTPLGAFWTLEATTFRLWAPQAQQVSLRLYETCEAEQATETPMVLGEMGVWEAWLPGNHAGRFYTFATNYHVLGWREGVDPYARSVGPQGLRGYLFDPRSTDPEGWAEDRPPVLEHQLDSVLYELSVRDASSLSSSGIVQRGQFLGLTEEGTVSPQGLATGLDHLVELGVTHVHLLPVFDFDGVDDYAVSSTAYNWGYNPRNFNALKLSFSSNPRDPAVAIFEFKQLVAAFHRKGLRVVMDVVYNHTFASNDSHLNRSYPFYYYRMYGTEFSNGSGCGNELATERPMVRRYILDSLRYWKSEFHLDGFRFDLMGLYDIDTMNEVSRELRKDDPQFLLYGEGWTGGLSTLPDESKAIKANAKKMREIAFFSDENRDALKGPVFEVARPGFVNGGTNLESAVKFAAVGCMAHSALGQGVWAEGPHQTINYVAAHDNHTLWDKLAHTNPDATETERIAMAKLAHGAVLLSQGIPFLHAGEEFLRSKQGVENSYNSPDSINGMEWSAKARYREVFQYLRGLISLRKAHPALRLRSAELVNQHVRFPELLEPGMVSWLISGHAGGDEARLLQVILNSTSRLREVHLAEGYWEILANAQAAGVRSLGKARNRIAEVEPVSLMVLVST
jgi:pullulanase